MHYLPALSLLPSNRPSLLVVEIDVGRLPGGSLDNCAIVVVGEKPESGPSIGIEIPSRTLVSGQIVTEDNALVTIARVTEPINGYPDGVVGYPLIGFNYIIQGICTE